MSRLSRRKRREPATATGNAEDMATASGPLPPLSEAKEAPAASLTSSKKKGLNDSLDEFQIKDNEEDDRMQSQNRRIIAKASDSQTLAATIESQLSTSPNDSQQSKTTFTRTQNSSMTTSVESQSTTTCTTTQLLEKELEITADYAPPCPLCGKDFRPGELHAKPRLAHIKSCATKNSFSTEKLLELVRLERKQAEERRALGLTGYFPRDKKKPPFADGGGQPSDKIATKTSTVSRVKKLDQGDGGGADPDLALALALSISDQLNRDGQEALAGSDASNRLGHDPGSISQGFGHLGLALDDQESGPSRFAFPIDSQDQGDTQRTESQSVDQTTASQSKMWLPQAPSGPIPRKRRNHKSQAKTVLETRTQAERERLIGERVANLLIPEFADSNDDAHESGRRKLAPRGQGASAILSQLEASTTRYWNLAALSPGSIQPTNLVSSRLAVYMDSDENEKSKASSSKKALQIQFDATKKEETLPKEAHQSIADVQLPQAAKSGPESAVSNRSDGSASAVENAGKTADISHAVADSFHQLSKSWLQMLERRVDCDLRLICRHEKELAAHKLVVKTRCHKLLRNVIEESGESSGGTDSYVILTDFDRAVIKVVLEYMYGGVFNLHSLTESHHLVQLKKFAIEFGLTELVDCLKSVEVIEYEVENMDNSQDNSQECGGGIFASDKTEEKSVLDVNEASEAEEEEETMSCPTQRLDALLLELDAEDDDEVEVIEEPSQKENSRLKPVNVDQSESENLGGNSLTNHVEQDGDNAEQVEQDWEDMVVALTQRARQSTDHSEIISSDDDDDSSDEGPMLSQHNYSRIAQPEDPETITDIQGVKKLDDMSAADKSGDLFTSWNDELEELPDIPPPPIADSVGSDVNKSSESIPNMIEKGRVNYTQRTYARSPSPDMFQSDEEDSNGMVSPDNVNLTETRLEDSSRLGKRFRSDGSHSSVGRESAADKQSNKRSRLQSSSDLSSNHSKHSSTLDRSQKSESHPSSSLKVGEDKDDLISKKRPNTMEDDIIDLTQRSDSSAPSPAPKSQGRKLEKLFKINNELEERINIQENLKTLVLMTDITIEDLVETKLGKTVRPLRTEPGEAGKSANTLIKRWKRLVREYDVSDQGKPARLQSDSRATPTDLQGQTDSQSFSQASKLATPNKTSYDKAVTSPLMSSNVKSANQTLNRSSPCSPAAKARSKNLGPVSPASKYGAGDRSLSMSTSPANKSINILSGKSPSISPARMSSGSSSPFKPMTPSPMKFDWPEPASGPSRGLLNRSAVTQSPQERSLSVEDHQVENSGYLPTPDKWSPAKSTSSRSGSERDSRSTHLDSENDEDRESFPEAETSFDQLTQRRLQASPDKREKSRSKAPENMIEDSYVVRGNVAGMKHREVVNNRVGQLRRSPQEKCTPLPDYEKMLSPQLRAELKKFGLKAIPRRKAVKFLNHIYEQTHPIVTVASARSPNTTPVKRGIEIPRVVKKLPKQTAGASKTKELATVRCTEVLAPNEAMVGEASSHVQNGCDNDQVGHEDGDAPDEDDLEEGLNCSQESQGSQHSDMPEESCYDMDYDDQDDQEYPIGSQVVNEGTLKEQLTNFIRSRPSLHQAILLYEPIWLKGFAESAKEAGIKCKVNQIMDFFDEECITFRCEPRAPRDPNKKKGKRSPTKKSTAAKSPTKKSTAAKSPAKPKSPRKRTTKK